MGLLTTGSGLSASTRGYSYSKASGLLMKFISTTAHEKSPGVPGFGHQRLCHLERYIAGMAYDLGSDLNKLFPQGSRPKKS